MAPWATFGHSLSDAHALRNAILSKTVLQFRLYKACENWQVIYKKTIKVDFRYSTTTGGKRNHLHSDNPTPRFP